MIETKIFVILTWFLPQDRGDMMLLRQFGSIVITSGWMGGYDDIPLWGINYFMVNCSNNGLMSVVKVIMLSFMLPTLPSPPGQTEEFII